MPRPCLLLLILVPLLLGAAGCSERFLAPEREEQRAAAQLAEKRDAALNRLVLWVERGDSLGDAARTLNMVTENRAVLVEVELREEADFSAAVARLGLPVHQRMPVYRRASVWVSSLAELDELTARDVVRRVASTQADVSWR